MNLPVLSLSRGVWARVSRGIFLWGVVWVAVWWIGSVRAQVGSEIVYRNDGSSSGAAVAYSAFEYGDEIALSGGVARKVSGFGFDYFGDFSAVKGATATLSFYVNDGIDVDPSSRTVLTPGTLLFRSDPIPLEPGYHEAVVNGLAIDVPARFTWAVQFSNLGQVAGDQAGLLFENPPSVGASFDDYWENRGGSWGIYRFGGAPVANFGAQVQVYSFPLSLPVLSNVSIPKDTTREVAITVNSVVADPGPLTLAASSDNPLLVDASGLVGSGSGLSWVLRVTPKTGQSGVANITVTVTSSSGLSASGTFLLTVTDTANPMVFTPIQDMVLEVGQASGPVSFRIIGLKEQGGLAAGRFTSSNQELVPDFNLNVGGDFVSYTSFQITVTPVAGKSGETTITLDVTAGSGATASIRFKVTVVAPVVLVAPVIVRQPVGVVVDLGGPLALSVSAVGMEPLSYQWKFNTVPLADDPALGVSGVSSATLRIVGVQSMMAGAYTVDVTNRAGRVTSDPAVVVVRLGGAPPEITKPDDIVMVDGDAAPVRSFNAVDPEGARIQIRARSSNQGLLPDARVVVSGVPPNLRVTVYPVAGQSGDAEVTLTATDGFKETSVTFNVRVIAVNHAPTIRFPNGAYFSVPVTQVALIPFTVSDVDDPVSNLVVSITGSDLQGNPIFGVNGLLSAKVAGSGGNRVLEITPMDSGLMGFGASLELTVSDGRKAGTGSLLVSFTPPPPPVIDVQPVGVTVGQGGSVSLSVHVLGEQVGYRWIGPAGTVMGTNATLVLPGVGPSAQGTYQVEVSSAGGSVLSDVVRVVVVGPPVIQVAPVGANIPAGSSVLLQGGAYSPLPISYRWRRDGLGILVDGPNVVGATTSGLLLTNILAGQAGDYVLVATGLGGSSTSRVATVSVQVPPGIMVQPTNRVVRLGDNVTLAVVASGTGPFGYQWRKNGVNLAGANGPVLNIPAVTLADGGSYTVAVSSGLGAVNSDSAVLALDLPNLPGAADFALRGEIVGMAGSGRGSNGGTTTGSGEPGVGGATNWVKWTAPDNGLASFSTIGSAFDTVLVVGVGASAKSLGVVQGDDDSGGFFTSKVLVNVVKNTSYSIGISGKKGAFGAMVLSWGFTPSAVAAPTVVGPADVRLLVVQKSPLTYAPGLLSVTTTGSNLSYQWHRMVRGVAMPISGATSSSYALTGASALGTYFVRVTGGGGTVDSRLATVTGSTASAGGVAAISGVRLAGHLARQDVTGKIREIKEVVSWSGIPDAGPVARVLDVGSPGLSVRAMSDGVVVTVEDPGVGEYVLEATADFRVWTAIAAVVGGAGGTIFVDPVTAGSDRRFYRVQPIP